MPKNKPDDWKRDGKRQIKYLVIHCTAGTVKDEKGQHSDRYSATVEGIRAYHKRPEAQDGRGWSDIGYNWVIEGSGAVKLGRPADQIPAGVFGFNEDSVHICVAGNFDFDQMPDDHPQWRALVQTAATAAKRHHIATNNILGHAEAQAFIGQPVTKSCPGYYLAQKLPQLRDEVGTYL